MKLSIRNFRGISRAEISLEPIALVAGRNEAGKSSIAQGLQALLTGDVVPIEGLAKKDAAMLIHAGTGTASLVIEREGGRVAIEYPKAKKETEGSPPSATPIACGMVSLPDMDAKARADCLYDYLKAQPSKEDLAAALPDLKPDHLDKLWQSIQDTGWNGAHQSAKDKGIQLKGAWREVTGENYGSSKAEKWIPPKWESDLEGASEESLQALVTQAGEIRDAAIAHTAISEDRMIQLREKAERAEELEQQKDSAAEEVKAAHAEVESTLAELKRVPDPDAEEQTTPCPHCGEPVVIQGEALAKPKREADTESAAQYRAERDKASQAHSKASLALKSANERKLKLEQELADATAAAEELSKIGKSDTQSDDEALEKARAEVDYANGRLDAWRAKTRADSLHRSISANQDVVDTLAADGLRQKKLRDALKGFNARLSQLAAIAKWPAPEVTDGLSVLYRGSAWALASESGKYRARTILQVALAEIDGSDALVIDGADILDKGGRNGLFHLLTDAGKPSLLCMTMHDRSQMPELKAGMGRSYWIENNVTE